MSREYFPSSFHLDNRLRYFLWSTDVSPEDIDHDEVWTGGGFAPTFATLEEVRTFAHEEVGVALAQEGEPILHELYWVSRWLRLGKGQRARQMRAGKSLTAWNIFSDLARGLKIPFRGDADELTPLWTKQLLGDPRKWGHYPRWSGVELQTTHDVLSEGLKLWRTHVR